MGVFYNVCHFSYSCNGIKTKNFIFYEIKLKKSHHVGIF